VSAVAIFRNVIHDRDRVRDVNVIGYQSGPVFRPRVTSGRAPARSGEVIVDEKLGLEPGDRIGLAGRELHVVGLTRGLRYYGGTPGMLMLLRDAQQIAYGGQQLASALVVQGVPTRRLDGFTAMTRDAVTRDLRRPLGSAIRTIGVLSVILWLVAAGIIALMVYLSSLDRRVDFAVYKAIGVPTRQLLGGLVLQVLLLALGAAAVATIASFVLAPLFPIPLEISGRAYIQLFATATLAGLVASSVSVRQASRVDPALAFGRGA
jgi:putative ABC transport system permease protein